MQKKLNVEVTIYIIGGLITAAVDVGTIFGQHINQLSFPCQNHFWKNGEPRHFFQICGIGLHELPAHYLHRLLSDSPCGKSNDRESHFNASGGNNCLLVKQILGL
jgi:hypothetical protein